MHYLSNKPGHKPEHKLEIPKPVAFFIQRCFLLEELTLPF
jgi:hypothetical protein